MNPSKICPQCGETFGPDERFCPKDGSALRPAGAADPLLGQVLADRYQILELLGEGGMGRVYLAEHVRMGRKSAVKVMSPNLALAADAISRFNREAANASRINHPNVAQIYDFGETESGLLYLAMEFIEGETLSAIVEREGPLPLPRAAGLIKQVADALAAAHHLGIVHRDLKPDNIMVARHHDGSDWVKVVDFGIAKTVQGSGERGGSQTVTTAGVSIGTPEYMSPEQLAGDRLDNRTDLYSLGLVLFNMLTGDLPYPRVTSRDTLVRRLTTRPLALAEVSPTRRWPVSLQTALDRALAPEPADRHASVSDFARDVLQAAEDVAVSDRTVPLESVLPSSEASSPPSTARTASASTATARTATAAIAPVRQAVQSPRTRGKRFAMIASGFVVLAAAAGTFFVLRGAKGTTSATAPHGDTSLARSIAAVPVSDSSTPPTAVPSQNANAASDTADAVKNPRPTAVTRTASTPATSRASVKDAPKPDSLTGSALPATGAAAGQGKRITQFRHAWLGANGDTAAAASTAAKTDEDRIRVITGDIQGHMARAKAFVQQGDVQKARAEYRNAVPVVTLLRQLYGGTADELRAEQAMRQENIATMAACRRTLADPAMSQKLPAGFRCETLIPLGIRPAGRRGAANVPFRDR